MSVREGMLRDAPHIPTWTGKRLQLMAPDPCQIDIEDIAHGLSYQGCYRGQTGHFYSLAQHSLLVASLVPPQHRLVALLHDAPAAYLGETSSPLRLLWPALPAIEQGLAAVIRDRFGLTGFDVPAVHRAHQVVLATEQRDLLPPRPENRVTRGRSAPIPRRIEFLSPEEARFQFIETFTELMKKNGQPARPAVDEGFDRHAGTPGSRAHLAGSGSRNRPDSGVARARRT